MRIFRVVAELSKKSKTITEFFQFPVVKCDVGIATGLLFVHQILDVAPRTDCVDYEFAGNFYFTVKV